MTAAASHDSEYPFLPVASCKFKPSAVKLSLTERWTWSLRSRAQRPKHVLHAKARGAQQSVQQLTRRSKHVPPPVSTGGRRRYNLSTVSRWSNPRRLEDGKSKTQRARLGLLPLSCGSLSHFLSVFVDRLLKLRNNKQTVALSASTDTKHYLFCLENQHTGELISARNTQHKYNNKDLSRLR